MKTIYKVTHNIAELNHGDSYTESRYFVSEEGAKMFYNLLRCKADFSRGEFAALDVVNVALNDFGQIGIEYITPLSYWSDDTKTGSEYYD